MMTLRPFPTILLAAFLTACTGLPEGIEPVTPFDQARYLGTWYEIARLDHPFERGMDNVTATYSLNDDGSIRVMNRGYQTEKNEWEEAEGRAVFVADKNTGHLKVSFFGPFYGTYVVFELDPDYQYAFVTSYKRDYLWLLARSPQIDDELRQHFLATAESQGFDTAELIFVQHDATPE